ncbi:MAG: tol-pal system-associated acyl-CoA thioesterase [Pseudomonadota bacterium]|jgi:acyl-CoA thioester hydrolase
MANFYWPVRVYWEDTDAGGVVFYANYLKFFERARTEWLRQLGIQQHTLRQQTQGMFVVTQTKVDYKAPARLDDKLCISVALLRRGRASLVLQQTAWRMPEQDDARLLPDDRYVCLCEGEIAIAWVHAHTLKPTKIPSEVLSALDTVL